MSDKPENNPNQNLPRPETAPVKIVWGTSMERNEGNRHISDKPAPEPNQKSHG